MAATVRIILCVLGLVCTLGAQTKYDLLLKGGHVIDLKNRIDGVRDVAVSNGKIARVAENIGSSSAAKTVGVAGLRAGKVEWDLNGRASQDWKSFPHGKR